jgi:hypothetical protein
MRPIFGVSSTYRKRGRDFAGVAQMYGCPNAGLPLGVGLSSTGSSSIGPST